MSVFENFKLLKSDMVASGWIIEAFPFNYKNRDYIVLAKLYEDGERKPKYALMKVEILKSEKINERLVSAVNVNGFIIEAKLLRAFFDIEYSENLGDLLSQFNEYFSLFIPTHVTLGKSPHIEEAMVASLSKSDSQDPNKRFCYGVMRNSDGRQRTPFNDNKTRLLRPTLYPEFRSDLSISFCYSTDANDHKSDAVIIQNFSNR
ncbi:DUF6037 family protein [Vibrio cholerae]|uniref:DUF6037 family protein n=2 Tax=Gammaproteobacteria TaxID=1236 RepID=UPI000B49050D|nr:DUF6037 family protein [Vibrio cholerae]ELJ8586077.1 hypothetical protein [Vibrio cholerae]TXZ39862.1 hypothetical protein FXE64_13055 [Vibrio cholerae]GHY59908.1 hypothetical protein VCSRO72_1558 [Vibrio cholerae]